VFFIYFDILILKIINFNIFLIKKYFKKAQRLQPLSYTTDFINFFNIKNKNQRIANMFFF